MDDETRKKFLELITSLMGEAKTDSIEIGTPSKGGSLKIYFDASKPEEAIKKIDNAFQVREHANSKANGGAPQ